MLTRLNSDVTWPLTAERIGTQPRQSDMIHWSKAPRKAVPMKYLRHILIAALLLAGLAACGGGAPSIAKPTAIPPTTGAVQPTTPPEPTGAPTAEPTQLPTAAPRATARAEPANADASTLVIYHKTGGIMGLDETLTVNADGTLALRSRNGTTKTSKIPADRLAKLRELLASPEYAKLQGQYKAMGADLFIYDISVPGGTPGHVQTMDGADTPAVLAEIIQELNDLRQAM
jgi:hypothetical protein